MINRILALSALVLVTACADEPAVRGDETAVKAIEEDQVKARQLSIEEAAEEATKIIEADAKGDVDAAIRPSAPAN